jgi:FSR family fosmidomycin resistance protein-like MFS transporter
LAAGAVLIPLLARVDGVSYLRTTALMSLLMIPIFLLVPGVWPKLLAAAALGFIGNGWYPIVQSRLYDELPGRSGTAMALTTVFGPIGTFMPFVIGAAAAAFGLQWAMWVVLAAPLSILLLAQTERRAGQRES